jgi:FkbM family methyltransferase
MRQFHEWSDMDERRYKFYRQFFSNGDIVFDVGANVGNRTKVFLKLHAQVVAFEPQHMCAEFLDRVMKGNACFTLIRKALGSEIGKAQILISDTHTISSMSPQWVESVKGSGRFAKEQWNKRQTVEVTTLDHCIKEYGRPTFMKIDVEGYEYDVISGLSQSIDIVSIEFTPEYLENTFKCIDHLCSLSDEIEFQISLGESMEWHLPTWVSRLQIRDALLQIGTRKFGDLYVRSAQKVS